jgi:hypothetical protein
MLSPSEWEYVFSLIDGTIESPGGSNETDNRRRMQAFQELALKDERVVESGKEISIWESRKTADSSGILTIEEIKCLLSEDQ